MKNQGYMLPPSDHSNLSVTDEKGMESFDLPDKEFKIAVLRKLNEL